MPSLPARYRQGARKAGHGRGKAGGTAGARQGARQLRPFVDNEPGIGLGGGPVGIDADFAGGKQAPHGGFEFSFAQAFFFASASVTKTVGP